MELFFTRDISDTECTLPPEESAHCVRVLRHRAGDHINVIDGEGTFYDCTLTVASAGEAVAHIDGIQRCWGAHPYRLTMAVCPTKNIDRFEWFAEKAVEMGVDVIAPVIGDHSERKVLKTERLRKILLSATKQSLKGAVPEVLEPVSVSDFIRSCPDGPLKLIAYCFEDGSHPRISIKDALASVACDSEASVAVRKGQCSCTGTSAGVLPLADAQLPSQFVRANAPAAALPPAIAAAPAESALPEIIVLIGPEGDFSRAEVETAIGCGFVPVHLGDSRLRTETAALTAVAAAYLHWMK